MKKLLFISNSYSDFFTEELRMMVFKDNFLCVSYFNVNMISAYMYRPQINAITNVFK